MGGHAGDGEENAAGSVKVWRGVGTVGVVGGIEHHFLTRGCAESD